MKLSDRNFSAKLRLREFSALRKRIRVKWHPDGSARMTIRDRHGGFNEIGRIETTDSSIVDWQKQKLATRGQIKHTWIDPKFRGMGLATKMYGEAMKQAPRGRLVSDNAQFDGGYAIWNRLQRNKGYKIRENPKADGAEDGFLSRDKRPLFIGRINPTARKQSNLSAKLRLRELAGKFRIPKGDIQWKSQATTMSPSEFLSKVMPFSKAGPHSASVEKYRAALQSGEKIRAPQIWVSRIKGARGDHAENFIVTGHEGRHRMVAAEREGVPRVPVEIIAYQEPRFPDRSATLRGSMKMPLLFKPEAKNLSAKLREFSRGEYLRRLLGGFELIPARGAADAKKGAEKLRYYRSNPAGKEIDRVRKEILSDPDLAQAYRYKDTPGLTVVVDDEAHHFPKRSRDTKYVIDNLNKHAARGKSWSVGKGMLGQPLVEAKDIDRILSAKLRLIEMGYTKPGLRDRIKSRIMASSKGGRPGQWSARKAQLVAQEYRAEGGGYKGGKTESQKSLRKWTREKWGTRSGKPSTQGSEATGERYLPESANKALSPQEYGATTRAKREGTRRGEQFVRQPERIAKKTAKHREFARGDYAIPALGKMLRDRSMLEEFLTGKRGPKLGDLRHNFNGGITDDRTLAGHIPGLIVGYGLPDRPFVANARQKGRDAIAKMIRKGRAGGDVYEEVNRS
jgi:predicted GNAT family acetyltransferase